MAGSPKVLSRGEGEGGGVGVEGPLVCRGGEGLGICLLLAAQYSICLWRLLPFANAFTMANARVVLCALTVFSCTEHEWVNSSSAHPPGYLSVMQPPYSLAISPGRTLRPSSHHHRIPTPQVDRVTLLVMKHPQLTVVEVASHFYRAYIQLTSEIGLGMPSGKYIVGVLSKAGVSLTAKSHVETHLVSHAICMQYHMQYACNLMHYACSTTCSTTCDVTGSITLYSRTCTLAHQHL